MAIYPSAVYRPLDRYRSDAQPTPPKMAAYDIINLHTAVTDASSLFGYFNRVLDTSHFYVNEIGEVEQYVDTDYQAAADREGNPRIISIETHDGYPRLWTSNHEIPQWNPAQVRSLVLLIQWLSETHNIPLIAVENSGPAARGVGFHRLGVEPWRVSGGESWSRSSGKVCPGDARIDQIPEIIKQARGQQPAPLPPPQKYALDYIIEIQNLLNQVGYSVLVDGILGPETKRAVSSFQTEYGLYVDSDPGPITYGTLRNAAYQEKDMSKTTSTYVNPFKGRITSRYSRTRRHPVSGAILPHLGTDIAPPKAGTRGLPIVAFGGGTVVAAGWNILSGRTGNGVLIEHSSGLRTYYGHLASVSVRKGQAVSPGQRIGICGATGNVTGIHLHFEIHVRSGGKWVTTDPQPWARNRGVTLGSGSTTAKGSSAVREYQELLKKTGHYKGLIDGIAGPMTINAVRAFQRQQGLVVDGYAGPITIARLKTVTKGAAKPKPKPTPKKPVQKATTNDRNIQRALATMGLYKGRIDGVNGPMQKAAVRDYQKRSGLYVDGNWGPVTQRHFDDIKRVQTRLNLYKSSYPKLKVDGLMGSVTTRKIRDIQTRNRPNAGAVNGKITTKLRQFIGA